MCAEGERLAEELREARRHEVPIVMVHEDDAERGGCEFATFSLLVVYLRPRIIHHHNRQRGRLEKRKTTSKCYLSDVYDPMRRYVL